MNLDCKPASCSVASDFHLQSILRAVDDLPDLDAWSPCTISSLIARTLVRRVEAPMGGYYLELTPLGREKAGLPPERKCK